MVEGTPQAGPKNGERGERVEVPTDIPEEGVRLKLTPDKIEELRREGYQVETVGENGEREEDWKRYDSPTPTVYTPPIGERFYGAEFDDVIEKSPPPPVDGQPPQGGPPSTAGFGDVTEPALPEDRPAPGTPIGEPNAGEGERVKGEENVFFKKLEEMVTDENIDQLGKTLKAYGGVDIPTDKLKKVLPKFMPVLTKYGNRVFGGENPSGFVKYSAEAEKYAELGNDIKPLLGAIIEAVMEPPTDQSCQVVLRPEDEQKFDKLEGEVNEEGLSEFLKDDDGTTGEKAQSGLPSDMVAQRRDTGPRPMSMDGRGGASHETYAAPDAGPKVAKNTQFESLEDLIVRQRELLGPSFDTSMAASKRREAEMKAQPELGSYENELAAIKRRDDDMRARPALEPAADPLAEARERDLMSRPALQKSDKPVSKKEVDDVDIDDFFDDADNALP